MSLYKGTTLISGAIPDMANQSLSNLNSTGESKFVHTSGDTMTGALTINTDDQDQIVLLHPSTTKGTNPSADYWTGIYFNDSQNLSQTDWKKTRLATIEHSLNTSGTSIITVGAVQNTNDGNANTSNLQLSITSAGVASCTFPNTTRCDGQFIPLWRDLISVDTSLNGSSELPYTIPEIENKGFFHMALITMTVNTGAASGNYVNGEIRSYISNIVSILRVKTRTASSMTSSGSCWIPVGTDGKIYVKRNANWNGSMSVLRCMGYRRIGYNENA